ncbi:MAG: DUF5916 domain-containing protein [Imperialibacter sp.]|uniref:DUF5916 domain-containing protein n=1 Tax=Imperialibacter sp. TaxID=2038411 RepID=UPI0032EF6968
MRHLTLFLFVVAIISISSLSARQLQGDLSNYQLQIKRNNDPIKVDGMLDEDSWSTPNVASDFWQQYPKDNRKTDVRTEVRMTYDADNLYIAAICYDVEDYVVQTLKRDNGLFTSDAFGIIIDPVNSNTNGFLFGVSPYNVQTEELLGPNATQPDRMTFSWDNRWYSAVTRYQDRYVVEMAIPFKTLRFNSQNGTWGVNFFRNDMSRNQKYSWTPLPVNFELYDLGYTGDLKWDIAPTKNGTNISVLPYVTGGVTRDNEAESPRSETSVRVGGDAKIALTSSLNLDLTVNPDFSTVDVDVQQTNLTRFNLRFPEKRGFFLENNDLFTEFGPNDAKPIFTRRMGLDMDNRPVAINYGARLSGNVTPNTRIGLLHLQTKSNDTVPGQNYSIAVFNQRIWSRSVLRGYVTNRQAYTQDDGWHANNYGRNTGLEFNYLNNSGTWNYFAAYHLSAKPDAGYGSFTNLGIEYAGRKWKARINYWNISSDYFADMGFFPRLENYDAVRDTLIHLGWERIYGRFGYVFRPAKGSKIVAHDIELRTYNDLYPDGTISDLENRIDYKIKFQNTAELQLQPQLLKTNLRFPTDFTDAAPLLPGSFDYGRFNVTYQSDARKLFSWQTEVGVGQYYNGTLTRYLLQLNYRRQPWGTFSVGWEQNNLKLPNPYGESNLRLVNARAEVNFSTKVFWTTFLQYNTQRENFNVNSRLQWRYSTMSDIFLVYSDNYTTSPFLQNNRNRAILLKLNYMFNL